MKYISLLLSLFLPTFPTLTGNENSAQQKLDPSVAIKMCLDGITYRNTKKIELGLRNGANVNYINSNGQSLFFLACETRKPSLMTPFITHKHIHLTELDSQGNTPLHHACHLGLSSVVGSMLSKNPELATIRNQWGCTPLHVASLSGCKKCILLLLSHNNTIINWQDNKLETALHNASKINVIKQLIKHGANPTIQNNAQRTPLMRLFIKTAAKKGNLSYSFLASNNALIHATDAHNNTQLHLCCAAQNINKTTFIHYLFFLTSNGVNANAKNNNGKRAVDLACEDYNAIYNYFITNRLSNICSFLVFLVNQERVMHAFLSLTSTRTQCALFLNLLGLPDCNQNLLPSELIRKIASIYYALQRETIIANKYQGRDGYYYDCIENKNEIKKQLLIHLEPEYLWSYPPLNIKIVKK